MMRSKITTAALALLLLAASASARVLRVHADEHLVDHCKLVDDVIGGWPLVKTVDLEAIAALGNYSILAGSAVTSTGLSSITGDIGLSPLSAVTGFTPILPGCFDFSTSGEEERWSAFTDAAAPACVAPATVLPDGGWEEMKPVGSDVSVIYSVIYTPTTPDAASTDLLIYAKAALVVAYNDAAYHVVSPLCMDQLLTKYNIAVASGDADLVAATASGVTVTDTGIAVTSPTPWVLVGDIGGRTITPGLYVSDAGLSVTNGDLTLYDNTGDGTGVWIFKMASTFEMAAGSEIILAGLEGSTANANNIFWQVGSSATLGAESIFKGTIMALASITVDTGVSVTGRLFARNAAVTMDSITIAQPAQ
jgi:hypothetical protein